MAHVRSLFFDGPLSEVENKALKAYTLGRPSDVIWNITNRCNLLCDHCYMSADGHAKPDQLSDEETIDSGHQMGELGVPLVFLSGGEPMMRKNFWDILEKAHGFGMHITVSTNATMIDRDAAKRLKANGVDWIATSLYGPPHFHDQMVGVPGTHAKVIEAIKILREEGVGVALKSAVSKDTLQFIPHIIAKAKELDARLVYLCDLITSGRSEGEEDARVSAKQWQELADWVLGDLLDPASNTEYDIGAIPSVIPYLAEKLRGRGRRYQQWPRTPGTGERVPRGQGPHEHQLRGRDHAVPVRAGLDGRQHPRHDAHRGDSGAVQARRPRGEGDLCSGELRVLPHLSRLSHQGVAGDRRRYVRRRHVPAQAPFRWRTARAGSRTTSAPRCRLPLRVWRRGACG